MNQTVINQVRDRVRVRVTLTFHPQPNPNPDQVLPGLTTALYKATPQLAGLVDIFGALG